MLMLVKQFLMMDRIWMTLEKEHMYWSIHMEGVLLVLLIKFYTKDLFGLVIEVLYCLSSTDKHLFTLCIMVQDFMRNIYHQKIRKNILMITETDFPPNKRLERSKIQSINLIIQIYIMLWNKTIYTIKLCFGHIQEENEMQQVMFY